MDENKIVLCGANAYEKKYYFNEEQFKMIPESIKEELHIICVLFTEEVGGVFTIAFKRTATWSWRLTRMTMTSITMRSHPDC